MVLLRRLRISLTTWPGSAQWGECLAVSVAALGVIAAIAWTFHLIHWQPRLAGWPLHLVMAMLVPALSEELVFRGVLIPGRGEGQHPVRLIAFGLLAFVAWHVIEATTILPNASLFLHPAFLCCAGLLGGACALMRYRTESLWPAVLLHGVTVFLWQALLGGPTIAELVRG